MTMFKTKEAEPILWSDIIDENGKLKSNELTKFMISCIASIGAMKIVEEIIDFVTPEDIKIPAKVMIRLGKYALKSIAGFAAMHEMYKTCDEAEEIIVSCKALRAAIKKAKEETETE